MSVGQEVQAIFDNMHLAFVPEKADGVDADIQINLTGPGSSDWLVRIVNNEVMVEQRQAPAPDLTIEMDAEDYIGLIKGEINPMILFATQRMKLQGNMALALKFQELFDRNRVDSSGNHK